VTVNFLIKKYIITLVPIEETFFQIIEFSSEKNLSYQSILFNYQNLSPFVDSDVSYIQKDDKLLLWFYDKKYKSMFTVPEGYLYSRYFSKGYKDILVTIQGKAIFVIQNHTLLYQSTIVEEVDILSKKYNIKETLDKSNHWHKKNYKKIINQPLVPIIFNFIDKKLLLQNIKERLLALVIPMFVLLSLMSVAHFFIGQYLQIELDKLALKKQETKIQTKEMFDSVRQNNQNIAYIQKHLKHHDQNTLQILEDIAKLIKIHSIKLFYFEYNRRFISLRAESESIESFLEDLSTIKSINSYKLTRQVKTKDDKKEITVEIVLKEGGKSE